MPTEPSATQVYGTARRAFLEAWRPTCGCSGERLELREERAGFECARHGAPLVRVADGRSR